MNKSDKYVRMPDEDQLIQLKDLMKNSHSARVRMRSHSVVLNSEGYSIDKTADIYHVGRDPVSSWIDRWEQSVTEGLYDKPRSGKPPALTESETEIVKGLIKEQTSDFRICLK